MSKNIRIPNHKFLCKYSVESSSEVRKKLQSEKFWVQKTSNDSKGQETETKNQDQLEFGMLSLREKTWKKIMGDQEHSLKDLYYGEDITCNITSAIYYFSISLSCFQPLFHC